MSKTVIDADKVIKQVMKYLNESKRELGEVEKELVCDTYIRYYVLRVEPKAINEIIDEVIKQRGQGTV